MKNFLERFKGPLLILLIFAALAIWLPATATKAVLVTGDYFKEMVLIMPPVFILMGLMEVWIPKNKIQQWLGSGSGLKGAALSVVLGTLPTGPVYVAFPMVGSLIRSGASITNMILFLGSWAALKIPQLMVEIKFLGLSFTLLRFGLTLIVLLAMGYAMEKILAKWPDKAWLESPQSEVTPLRGKMKK